ncbi:MAG: DUF2924 domain-containing protein [Rhodospirillaceae bacterium]
MHNQSKPAASLLAESTRRVKLTPSDLSAELARLSYLSIEDLKLEWEKVIGGAAPKNARRDYLVRALAHELQCRTYGGMAKPLHRSIIKVAAAERKKGAPGVTRSLKTGVRLFREYKNALHEVEVVDGGFRYDGTTYKSLSVIARRITGGRWSGPAFFGVKREFTGGGNGR